MPDLQDNSLERFERRSISYSLIIVGAFTFLCLFAGAVASVRSQEWTVAALFTAGLIAFAIFVMLSVTRNRRLTAASDRKFIKWDAALPELQRQNVNLEVKELARLLGVDSENMSDLLSAYVVAEDLALRQIQQEEKLPLLRHVQLGTTTFDAILIEHDTITCIEVSFLVVPDVRQDKIESILKKVNIAKRDIAEMKIGLRIKLMLVLVTQLTMEEQDHLRGKLITRRFSDTPVDIDIRLLDFESLQTIYITD